MKLYLLFFLFLLPAESRSNCGEGLESFKKTLHPLLMQRCANCHGDDGIVVEHSQIDSVKAYGFSKKFVDFENIYASTFMRKVKSAHWLNMDPDEGGMSSREMETALTNWWEGGEKLCPPMLTYFSQSIQLPVNLPTRISGEYLTLSWDVLGCEFIVDIQRFTEWSGSVPGSYRIRKPQIRCSSGLMKIERIRFMINGRANSFENIFEEINTSLTHDGTFKKLSDEQMIIIDQFSEIKELVVGFGVIRRDTK